MRSVAPVLLIVVLTSSACGVSEPDAPVKEEAPRGTTIGPRGAGSGTTRDDDCVHLTRGEFAEIVVLDNVFAPECPVVVGDQVLRLRNLGVRVHTFTISENRDDVAPFLLDLTIEGDDVLETESVLGEFVEPGLYEFFCKFHPGMDGVMQVVEPVASRSEPPATQPPESSPEAEQECVDFTKTTTVLLTMVDNRFVPSCLTISREQRLTIRNEGVSLHNISLDFRKALTGTDLDLDVSSGEGSSADAVGEILRPGTFEVFCKYHLPEMVAKLKVL
jgi:plastocyanin